MDKFEPNILFLGGDKRQEHIYKLIKEKHFNTSIAAFQDNVLERIKEWTDDTLYVLTDFDRTITVGNSDSSWSILSKSDMVPKEYVVERQEFYNK